MPAGGQSAIDRLGELSYKAYLWLQMEAKSIFDRLLSDRDQLANILRGCLAEVDHDVRVNVRDLSITVSKSFQPALIHESAGTDSLDLLEDRPGAWVELKPGMSASSPAQILLHDAMHHGSITG
jgi:hypothetical protein